MTSIPDPFPPPASQSGDSYKDHVEIYIDNLMRLLNMDPDGIVTHLSMDSAGYVRVVSESRQPIRNGQRVARGGEPDLRAYNWDRDSGRYRDPGQ